MLARIRKIGSASTVPLHRATSGEQLSRIANVSIRVATLGSKFVLLFVLAKFMSPEEVGQYGLIAATISYALFVLGLDFYTYSTREMLTVGRESWPTILINQGIFFSICYILMLPALYLILSRHELIRKTLISEFFLLLIFEHIAQELNRILVVMSRPVFATVLGFLRGGIWVFACVAVMIMYPGTRVIETVIIAWIIGCFSAIVFGLICVRDLSWSVAHVSVDWRWIWRGVRVCVPLLVATLAIRGLFIADRYLEGHFAGAETLGVYTFYISIANAIQAFLDAAVYSFQYPRVVAAAGSGDAKIFNEAVRRFRTATTITILVLGALAAGGIWPVIELLNRPLYREHYGMFLWILVGSMLFSFSMIPHYVLYALRLDRAVIVTNLGGAATFIVAAPLLALHLKALAVPVALALACGAMYVSKLIVCRRCGLRESTILTP